MTLLMRDREKVNLGEMKKTVSIIKNMDISDIEITSKILKVDVDYINKVLSLINENPDMDDEEIAEILMEE